MNKEGRQRRLVLKVKPGESIRVQVSDGHWLIVRRDQHDPNKMIFEEITALAEKPYFRVSREGSAAVSGDKSVASHKQNVRMQNPISQDTQGKGGSMNEQGRQRRLVLKVRPGESIRVQVSDGHWLIVRRDQRDPNKLFFEEMTAPDDNPYFRICRVRPAAVRGDKSIDGHEQPPRRQNRFGEDAQTGI